MRSSYFKISIILIIIVVANTLNSFLDCFYGLSIWHGNKTCKNVENLYYCRDITLEVASIYISIFPQQIIKDFPSDVVYCYNNAVSMKNSSVSMNYLRFKTKYYYEKVNTDGTSFFTRDFYSKFVVFKNMFLGGAREISDYHSYYTQSNYEGGCHYNNVKHIVGYCEHGIAGFDYFCMFYGDVFKVISYFFMFPVSILNNSTIPVLDNYPMKQISQLFNIVHLNINLLPLNNEEVIFCGNVYTIATNLKINQYFDHTFKIVAILYQRFLNTSKPSLYVLLNRKKYGARYISNFKTLEKNIRKEFSQYDWVVYPPSFNSIPEAARQYSKIKFILHFVGSNVMNMFFAHSHTGQVIISTIPMDLSFFLSTAKQIWTELVLIYKNDYVYHYIKCKIFVSFHMVSAAIRDVIYAVLNQRWPSVKESDVIEYNASFDFMNGFSFLANNKCMKKYEPAFITLSKIVGYDLDIYHRYRKDNEDDL